MNNIGRRLAQPLARTFATSAKNKSAESAETNTSKIAGTAAALLIGGTVTYGAAKGYIPVPLSPCDGIVHIDPSKFKKQ